MTQQGNIDYTRGTPIETEAGEPVLFFRTSWNPFTRWKYGCIIQRVSGNVLRWYDANGVPQEPGPRIRHVAKQLRYEISDDAVFYDREQAERYADKTGLRIAEVTIGDNGKVLKRKVVEG